MNAEEANDTQDSARELQRALYRAAKAVGNADSGAMKDLGKPDEGEPHVRFDEGRLETGLGLGTAVPAK